LVSEILRCDCMFVCRDESHSGPMVLPDDVVAFILLYDAVLLLALRIHKTTYYVHRMKYGF